MKPQYLICFLIAISGVVQAQDKEAYILRYKDIAISEMHRTGIPASIKLAQAILESSYGRSELARKANNHFGIKCGSDWTGDGYHLKDDDRNARGELVHSCFRVFQSPEESFIAHSDFLTDPGKSRRYGSLFNLAPDDYKGWAEGLQRSGYATNPHYARMLIKIIQEEHLYVYDVKRTDEDLATPYLDSDYKYDGSDVSKRTNYTVQFQNDIPYVTLRRAEEVKSLSKRLDVPVRKIVRYNEIVDNRRSEIETGEKIYLQPMKRKYHGSQKSHVVQRGETIVSIAHDFGVKSKILRKRNGLAEDCEPAPGSRLVLRGKQRQHIPCATENTFIAATPTAPAPTPSHPPAAATEVRASEPETETVAVETAAVNTPSIFATKAASYTVQPKDTLYQIATQNGLTVAELKELNNLSGNIIHPGQTLKVSK